jgi:repressor LexA
MITSKDKKILNFIQEHSMAKGYAPTLAEIKEYFAYKSMTSVQRSVWSLERQGYIERDRHKSRGIRLPSVQANIVQIPLVGNVACGMPLLATQNIEGYIQTDVCFVKSEPSRFFYLTAVGDSMNKAGINDGDLVLVRSTEVAEPGDIVVALIDDHATIKVFQQGKGYVKLVPKSTNSAFKPIILRDDFQIQGIVVRVFSQ